MNNSKLRKNLVKFGFIFLQFLLLLAAFLFLIPFENGQESWSTGYTVIFIGIIFLFIVSLSCNKYYQIEYFIKDKSIKSNESKLIYEFIERMKACYSYEDFFAAVAEVLEQKANCSVIYLNCEKDSVMYASPNNISTNDKVLTKLKNNYPISWKEGCFFFDGEMNRASFAETARGFFLSSDNFPFFVFCRYARLLSTDIFDIIYDEFSRFQERMITMNRLTEMERVTHDWHHLDDIKKAYMKVPDVNLKTISLATFCKPNLDEAASYTTAIPLNENELLIVFGDDEIKGLSSLLSMSVVLNTIRIAADKHNMSLLTKLIIKALEDLHLESGKISLFIGIINSMEHTITYVNYGIKTAVVINAETKGVERLPAVSTILEDAKQLNLSPITQFIAAKNVLILASNNELCQKPELLKTAVFNVEATAQNLLESVCEVLDKENPVQAADSTLLAAKVEE